MQEGDLVVERGGEDGAQGALQCPDAGRADTVPGQAGDPFADVGRHDLVHPQGPEARHDVPANAIGIGLLGGQLDHVIGQTSARYHALSASRLLATVPATQVLPRMSR
jgi:hypothetical protein